MAGKTRKLTIEIVGEDRSGGKAFDSVAKDAKRAGSKIEDAGKEAGEGFTDKLKSGVSGVGSVLENAGSTAGDLFSGGFDVGQISDTISGAFQGLSGKLGPVAAGAGAVVAGAFAVGLFNGFEQEVATDRLAAQLGGGEWAEDMGDIAGSLYTQAFGDSVADTAGAVRLVVQRKLLPEDATKDAIEGLTAQFLTFTDVLEQDMDMATQAVSRMVKSGIAEDGTEALDILTRGIQKGADNAGDLLETFQEYSIEFAALGLSAEEATGLMIQGLGAGARDADKVADALKEVTIRGKAVADGNVEAARGFELLGLDAERMAAKIAEGGPTARNALDQIFDGLKNIEDPVLRNEAALELFGTQSEDLQEALFALDLDTAARRLGDFGGSTDDLGEAYDNASTKIEEFRRKALQKLTVFVGDSVLPKLEALGDWAKDNPVAFKVIAGIIGGVLVTAFAAWAVSAASAAVATIAATWPILAIIAAVVAFAAIVMIHKDTIIGAFKAVWQWLKDNWPTLLGILTGPIGLAVLLIVKHWDKISGAAKAVFRWLKENWPLLLAIITGPIGLAVLAVVKHWQKIKAGFSAVKNWIGDRIGDIVGFFRGLPGRVGGFITTVKTKITGAMTAAKNWVGDRVDDIVGFIVDIPSRIGDIGGQIFDKITGGLGGFASDVAGVLGFDKGGVVPGPKGAPRLILAHGGETIFPTHDRSAMRGIGAGLLRTPAAMGIGGDSYVIDLRNSMILSEIDLERTVTRAVNHAQGKGVTVKRRRRR